MNKVTSVYISAPPDQQLAAQILRTVLRDRAFRVDDVSIKECGVVVVIASHDAGDHPKVLAEWSHAADLDKYICVLYDPTADWQSSYRTNTGDTIRRLINKDGKRRSKTDAFTIVEDLINFLFRTYI